MRRIPAALFLVLLSTILARAQEQMHFSAEEEGVQFPVQIPDDAWAILQGDEYVKGTLENESLSA